MKKITALVIFVVMSLFVSLQANADDSAINWQSWSNSLFAKAKKENKQVLVYVKASWCPWCQKMDRTTLADPTIIALINKRFVAVRFDIDNDAAQVKQFKVPNGIIYNANHKRIKSFSGYQTAAELQQTLS
jgi:thiol:disulfide interchange protein